MIFESKTRKGFTLAEILITLSIIGVIASMTIPSLVQDVQDAQLKTAWKKGYSEIAQGIKRYSIDQAGNFKGIFLNNDDFRNKLLTYINYTKKCDSNTALGLNGCWHEANNWLHLNGNPTNLSRSSQSRAILNNGTLIIFGLQSTTCNYGHAPSKQDCGIVNIDINGYKGPNTVGRDIYEFRVLKDGNIVPSGAQGDSAISISTCSNTSSGWGCSAKFLYE